MVDSRCNLAESVRWIAPINKNGPSRKTGPILFSKKGNKMSDEIDDDVTNTDVATPETTTDSTPDIAVYEAKIAALESALLEKDSIIAIGVSELQKSKADNYDLLMSMPKDADSIPDESDDTDNDVNGIEDLFTTTK